MSQSLTHLNQKGEAQMVDISCKDITHREACARSIVCMQSDTLTMITEGRHKKGDVFAVARIAGIQAAKKCSELIPLCHPLMLTKITVDITADPANLCVIINTCCKLDGKTGVEMEALTAASVAALTLYDMCKAVDKSMVIKETRLMSKTGGKSGDWLNE